jgi:hypothetical protein
MNKELISLMTRSNEIRIVSEFRRCEIDSSGLELPEGRDNYALWNWTVDNYTNDWPGFWDPEDCINDMIAKCNIE